MYLEIVIQSLFPLLTPPSHSFFRSSIRHSSMSWKSEGHSWKREAGKFHSMDGKFSLDLTHLIELSLRRHRTACYIK